MAVGWAGDGAVHDQIQDSLNDEIARVRASIPQGVSADFCDECGDPIPEARRNAMPGVRLCVDCQEEIERLLPRFTLYNRKGSKDSQLR